MSLHATLGRRIQKDVNGTITRYVYDNEDILFEYDANSGDTRLNARRQFTPEVWRLLNASAG